MAKNDSKAQKAARNLEQAARFKQKKGPTRPAFGSGGPRPAGGPVSGGGASSGPRQFYPAICGACGTATEVPFQPTEGREVLCRACFKPADR